MARLMYEGKTLEFKIGGEGYWAEDEGFYYKSLSGKEEPLTGGWTAYCRIKQKPKCEFNLKPFDKVLVRYSKSVEWRADFFSRCTRKDKIPSIYYPWLCVRNSYAYIAPYEGNEQYLGTTDDIPGAWGPEDVDE